ncbi:flavoprotein [Cristinia sonorae]|uniref:Flavoprotein n=1 Tax=Cristinia sonorae TaxID=1940300 RepID=A0A8K0UNS0_9AGAR|nr:flavoprotein [Cristinia sonorae]
MTQLAKRIALIVGSSRTGGNGAGIAAWLSPIIQNRLNRHSKARQHLYEVVIVDPTKPPHPFGPVIDGSRNPSHIRNPAEYSSESIRKWSSFVSSCSGFVILTPEYNGGYPGELKNAIDHLYWEWKDKSAMVVSYGGGGGTRSAAQLRAVLSSIKLRQVSRNVQIRLPKTFSGGEERVPVGSGVFPEFLAEYVEPVEEATGEFLDLLQEWI